MIFTHLEPPVLPALEAAKACSQPIAPFDPLALSIAISLKRIADAVCEGSLIGIDPYSFGRDLGLGFQHGKGQ